MEIKISAALTDEESELLEGELGGIVNELGLEGIEVWGIVWEDDNAITSVDICYEEADRPDDDQLRSFVKQILGEFERIQSDGTSLTRAFRKVTARVGRIRLEPA